MLQFRLTWEIIIDLRVAIWPPSEASRIRKSAFRFSSRVISSTFVLKASALRFRYLRAATLFCSFFRRLISSYDKPESENFLPDPACDDDDVELDEMDMGDEDEDAREGDIEGWAESDGSEVRWGGDAENEEAEGDTWKRMF